MAYNKKKLSIFADRIIPDFIQADYPEYVTFIRKYFEYLERRVDIYNLSIVEIFPGSLFAPDDVWNGVYVKTDTNDTEILEHFTLRAVGNEKTIGRAIAVVDYNGDKLIKIQAIQPVPFTVGDRLYYSDIGEYSKIAELFMTHDVDEVYDEFLYLHRLDMMPDFPVRLYGNLRLLLKRIKTFYATKGTVASFEVLFSIVYDTFVEITYPKEDILIASDGEWKVGNHMDFGNITEQSVMEYWQDKYIVGLTSGARCYLESFVYVEYPHGGGSSKWIGYSTNMIGLFENGELVADQQSGEVFTTLVDWTILPGKWMSDKGHLSGTKKLQDNARYQNFTYVLKTDIDSVHYTEMVDKLVHPVGFLRFTELGEKAIPSIPVTDMSLAYLFWIINMYTLDIIFPFNEVDHYLTTANWWYTDRGVRYTYRDIELLREADLQVIALWGHRSDTLDVFRCEEFDIHTADPFEYRPPSIITTI